MSIFVEVSRSRSVGPVTSASTLRSGAGKRRRHGWIRAVMLEIATRLSDWTDRVDGFEPPRSPARHSDAMITAARSPFANVDIVVGKTGIRYVARPVAKM
jgi:hypothetical protein